MFTLYSMPSSGNSYKVRLLLAHLGLDYTHIAAEYEGSKVSNLRTDKSGTKKKGTKVEKRFTC